MKYFILFIFFLFISCSESENHTTKNVKIDIENKSNTDLLDISIKSVYPIETNESSLFGNISAIEYFSDRIYFLDIYSSKSLMVFSNKGNFLNKTKLGNGPDEIINPFAFFVDRFEKNVLVWDQTLGYMYKYDLDLNFLSREKYDVPIMDFAKLNKNEILVRSHFHQDYAYTLYSSNFETKKQYIQDFKYSGAQGIFRSISVNNRILLISSFDYNIYQLIDGKLKSEYYFDFGKYEIKREDIERRGLRGNWEQIVNGQRVSAPHEIAESNNFLLFHVYFKGNPVYFIYSITHGKIYNMDKYIEKGLLPKCQIRGIIENDIFYAIVEPIDMIEFQETTKQKLVGNEIEVQQNPFIMTFSISDL